MNEKLLEFVGKTLKTILALLTILLSIMVFVVFGTRVLWIGVLCVGMILYSIVSIYFLLTNKTGANRLADILLHILLFILAIILILFFVFLFFNGGRFMGGPAGI
jgi:hypothetical protein